MDSPGAAEPWFLSPLQAIFGKAMTRYAADSIYFLFQQAQAEAVDNNRPRSDDIHWVAL
jgi:hypothetical protein